MLTGLIGSTECSGTCWGSELLLGCMRFDEETFLNYYGCGFSWLAASGEICMGLGLEGWVEGLDVGLVGGIRLKSL